MDHTNKDASTEEVNFANTNALDNDSESHAEIDEVHCKSHDLENVVVNE